MDQQGANLSCVIPVHNEKENIIPLLKEIEQLFLSQDDFEVICVDDHSTDGTSASLLFYQHTAPWLKIVHLRHQQGQSAAICHGVRAASGGVIVTLDGDGQNDPADIKKVLTVYRLAAGSGRPCLVNGHRVARKDTFWRRFSSYLANQIRRRILGDDTLDSGCGMKVFQRDVFLELPAFHHMHRFLPALIKQRGGQVLSVSVNHRQRCSGRSHYGTIDRLMAGVVDLLGVAWLGKRLISWQESPGESHRG